MSRSRNSKCGILYDKIESFSSLERQRSGLQLFYDRPLRNGIGKQRGSPVFLRTRSGVLYCVPSNVDGTGENEIGRMRQASLNNDG